MWIALRPFRYRNTKYIPGDRVPAESWVNRKALATTRRIKYIPDPVAEPEPLNLKNAKRAELEAYARQLGIEDAENKDVYPNRDTLIAKIESVQSPSSGGSEDVDSQTTNSDDQTPPDATVSAETDSAETPPTENDDVDPFADLDSE